VELATEPTALHTPLFSWVLRRHNLICYMLYMGGAWMAWMRACMRGC